MKNFSLELSRHLWMSHYVHECTSRHFMGHFLAFHQLSKPSGLFSTSDLDYYFRYHPGSMVETLDMVGYCVPQMKHVGTYFFCSQLSRQYCLFLAKMGYYKSFDALQLEALFMQECCHKHNHFKLENVDDWNFKLFVNSIVSSQNKKKKTKMLQMWNGFYNKNKSFEVQKTVKVKKNNLNGIYDLND